MLRREGDQFESRLVWIFGSPRSGSTWLMVLLGQHERVQAVNEPLIGYHLAPFAPHHLGLGTAGVASHQLRFDTLRADEPSYFLSRSYAGTWRPLLARLILERLRAEAGDGDTLVVIKEPHGSQAADLVLSLLPESRLLFLLRDGRDVVDSSVDAFAEGSQLMQALNLHTQPPDRLSWIAELSRMWAFRTEVVQRAYDRHSPERRLLVRYEDLLADTEVELARIHRWLGLETSERFIRSAVTRLAFDGIDERGTGKFVRAASPGLWRKNMTRDEQDVMQEVMGEKLRELAYPS